jgi:hypothetical protein
MKKDIFNFIYLLIQDYEKIVGEKPYMMLVSPTTYDELIKYLEETTAWRYLSKLKNPNEKINYIFGVPIEISCYIIQDAICINEDYYKKYCIYKFMKNKGEINEQIF